MRVTKGITPHVFQTLQENPTTSRIEKPKGMNSRESPLPDEAVA